MFGFLPAPCSVCNQEASTYRSFFCGLSSTLAKEYGHAARFLTNRDGTFVSLLVAAQQEHDIESRFTTCCNPIGKKRVLFDVGEHARYAAAISVCGVYTKLKDDAEDESGVRRHTSKVGVRVLDSKVEKAVRFLEDHQFPAKQIRQSMDQQDAIEKSTSDDWQLCASTTANAFAEIFSGSTNFGVQPNREILGLIGGHLGRIIYLLDAWEDREEDVKLNRFNPLRTAKYANVNDWFQREFERLSQQFSKLSFNHHSGLIESILIDGVFSKGERVLAMGGAKRKKESGKTRWYDWCDCCHCCQCCGDSSSYAIPCANNSCDDCDCDCDGCDCCSCGS